MTRKKKKSPAKKKRSNRSLKNPTTPVQRKTQAPRSQAPRKPRKKDTPASHMKAARSLLESELGELSVKHFKTKGVTKRKKVAKEIAAVKRQIHKLQPEK